MKYMKFYHVSLDLIYGDTLTGEVSRAILAPRNGGGHGTIRADVLRGHTDAVILAQLMRRDSYGYEINKTIESLSGGAFVLKEATLYTAFRRLEDSGLIVSYWGDEAVGARRKYYKITQQGREAYRQARAEWADTVRILHALLEEEA